MIRVKKAEASKSVEGGSHSGVGGGGGGGGGTKKRGTNLQNYLAVGTKLSGQNPSVSFCFRQKGDGLLGNGHN